MRQTIPGAQQQVDKHAATPHPTGVQGASGGTLPAGATDGQALTFNATSGLWVPTALAGGSSAASLADPLNVGFGYSFDPFLANASAGIGTANRAYFYRMVGGSSVSKIGLFVVTASGHIDVGLYANTGTGRSAMPAAKAAAIGTTVCPAAGYRELALGSTVATRSGDFWLAIAADNATAAFQHYGGASGIMIQGRMAWQDTAFPLPVSAGATNGAGSGGGSRGFCLVGVP